MGVSRCKLIYIGWINKVLLYSTGNYIQYPVINHNGNEYKKNAYICTKSFCLTVFSFTINICFNIIKAISFLKKMDSLIFIFMVLVPECLLILYHFIFFLSFKSCNIWKENGKITHLTGIRFEITLNIFPNASSLIALEINNPKW